MRYGPLKRQLVYLHYTLQHPSRIHFQAFSYADHKVNVAGRLMS